MTMTERNVTLSVNDEPVLINEFVQKLISNVISGMLTDLKGTDNRQKINIAIDGDDICITTGGNSLQTNPFVGDFIRKIVISMTSSLKKVEKIDRLEINIT